MKETITISRTEYEEYKRLRELFNSLESSIKSVKLSAKKRLTAQEKRSKKFDSLIEKWEKKGK